jgi:hypothetical protein
MCVALGHCARQSTASQEAHVLPYVAGNNVALSKGASLLGGNPVFSPVQLQSALAVMARDASSQGGDSQKELTIEKWGSRGKGEGEKNGKRRKQNETRRRMGAGGGKVHCENNGYLRRTSLLMPS